jgi:hypothetical protein
MLEIFQTLDTTVINYYFTVFFFLVTLIPTLGDCILKLFFITEFVRK